MRKLEGERDAACPYLGAHIRKISVSTTDERSGRVMTYTYVGLEFHKIMCRGFRRASVETRFQSRCGGGRDSSHTDVKGHTLAEIKVIARMKIIVNSALPQSYH